MWCWGQWIEDLHTSPPFLQSFGSECSFIVHSVLLIPLFSPKQGYIIRLPSFLASLKASCYLYNTTFLSQKVACLNISLLSTCSHNWVTSNLKLILIIFEKELHWSTIVIVKFTHVQFYIDPSWSLTSSLASLQSICGNCYLKLTYV